MKKLTLRLSAAIDMLCGGDTLVDIGADHGYLTAAALIGGKFKNAIAADISRDSLKKAEGLIKELGLENKVAFAVTNGFSGIAPKGSYSAAILGMGGELIAAILCAGGAAPRLAKSIVMQPMGGEAELRRYLYANGYNITDERIVKEAGRYYQLILAQYDGLCRPLPTEGLLEFGAVAYAKRERELLPLLIKKENSRKKRLDKAMLSQRQPEGLKKELEAVRLLIDGWNDFDEEKGNEA